MNFTELLAELVARGAQDDDTRNGRWINLAYQDIVNGTDWPFTVAEATGTTGAGTVVVSDVRKVIAVGDVSNGTTPGTLLQRISYDELASDQFVENIAQTGTPQFWWLDETSDTIKAYPVGGTIFVRYFQRLSDLSGTALPAFDAAYHNLIVDRAMVEVYLDDDQFDAAAALQQKVDRGVAAMIQHYERFAKEPTFIQVVDPYDG